MKNKQPIPVSFLNPGDSFEFVNIGNNYKDCKVKRNSEAGTWIEGSHRHGKEQAFKPLSPGYVISNSSMVYLIE